MGISALVTPSASINQEDQKVYIKFWHQDMKSEPARRWNHSSLLSYYVLSIRVNEYFTWSASIKAIRNGFFFYEQCVYVKFCFTLGKPYLHTVEMLKHAIEDKTMIRTQTQDQYKHFKEGQTSTENNERS